MSQHICPAYFVNITAYFAYSTYTASIAYAYCVANIFLLQISVPLEYAHRLKTIFSCVIQRVHRTAPIIETVATPDHHFETLHNRLTVGNFTRRYYGAHEKNSAGIEAAAIFYSLKHISNVLGFRIIDLNYPTLAKMTIHIDKWNACTNMLQLIIKYMVNETNELYQQITHACEAATSLQLQIPAFQHIDSAASQLCDILNRYCSDIISLCKDADNHKVIYILLLHCLPKFKDRASSPSHCSKGT